MHHQTPADLWRAELELLQQRVATGIASMAPAVLDAVRDRLYVLEILLVPAPAVMVPVS